LSAKLPYSGAFPLIPFAARKTFLRRFHPILQIAVRLEDKSAMDNVFTFGEVVPYSGVYRITHSPPHTGEEALTLTKGSTFPQCVHCSHVSFMLIYQPNHSELLTLEMLVRSAADGSRRIPWQKKLKISALPPALAKATREPARSSR
jgi:hypothetical protein